MKKARDMALMRRNKLNFGCGSRFSDDWVNIDFHSEDSRVRRVNLLNGLPFSDATFEAVYSSHVLEHFDRPQGQFLISEAYRVLAKNGILRIVVPDLEGSCREYLRVLALPESEKKQKLYAWIIAEMIDQMVRSRPLGEMGELIQAAANGNDVELQQYIVSRTQPSSLHIATSSCAKRSLNRFSIVHKLTTKIAYYYASAVSRLLPQSLRSMVFLQTSLGERHRWMYDEYGLRLLFQSVGFRNIRRLNFDESGIANFNSYGLDIADTGEPYKNNSLYMEGTK